MEKKMKCRKDYVCDQCDGTIYKSELSLYGTERQPRFDNTNHEVQIGIEYVKWRLHADPKICDRNIANYIF